MERLTFEEVLEPLGKLDSWLNSLGVTGTTDRWHECIRIMRLAKVASEMVERGETRPEIANYVHGLFEAMEMHEIFCAFSEDTSEGLREKIQRALSGPVTPLDEQPRNSGARNTMFELFLAASWKNRGLSVEIGEPDILLDLEGNPFLVECKRPFSENSVSSNIEDSVRQLRKQLNAPEHCLARGVVAISLTRVITENNRVCCSRGSEGKDFISNTLVSVVADHDKQWRVRHLLDLHPRIVAVMFHLAAPWDIGGERLVYMSAEHFVPAKNSDPAGQSLLRRAFERK